MMTMLQPRLLKVSAVLLALALPCGFAGHSAFAQAKKDAPKQEPQREPAPADKPDMAPPPNAPPSAKEANKNGPPGQKTAPLPKSPAEREKALNDLYALLATSDSEESAKAVAEGIERIWLHSGSATIDLLMERAMKAVAENKLDLAIKLLDRVVDLAPDYPEAWNRRAFAHYKHEDVERALGDLRRTLALDPNHFKALDGLSQILREVGQKKGALKVMRQLLDVHPYWPSAQQNVDELAREVEGQGI
jgi:Flp pilus assembly protein TadD